MYFEYSKFSFSLHFYTHPRHINFPKFFPNPPWVSDFKESILRKFYLLLFFSTMLYLSVCGNANCYLNCFRIHESWRMSHSRRRSILLLAQWVFGVDNLPRLVFRLSLRCWFQVVPLLLHFCGYPFWGPVLGQLFSVRILVRMEKERVIHC